MIERVVLATVTRVPEWHPEHASFEPFPVHGWVIRQPDGVVLVDTGIGVGNELIDQWYAPEVTLLSDAVADLNDVAALVLSHLHFDHCGQQAAVDAPVYVQSAEWEAAKRPRYSIPAWATIPAVATASHRRRRRARAGHSRDGDAGPHAGTSVSGDRCSRRTNRPRRAGAFRAEEIRTGEPSPRNLESPDDAVVARESLARIRALAPATAHFSHDPDLVLL